MLLGAPIFEQRKHILVLLTEFAWKGKVFLTPAHNNLLLCGRSGQGIN